MSPHLLLIFVICVLSFLLFSVSVLLSPRQERRGSPVSAASTAATSPVLSEEGELAVDEMLVDR